MASNSVFGLPRAPETAKRLFWFKGVRALVTSKSLAQRRFLHFPAGRQRQRRLEQNGLRHLISSQICPAVLLKLPLAYLHPWLGNDQGRYLLTPIRIGSSDHGGH